MQQINIILLATQFLEKMGISIENMKINYDENSKMVTFTSQNHDQQEKIYKTIQAKLDEKNNSITIKNDVRREYGFKTIGDDPMTNYETYNVDCNQTITKFKAKDKVLNKYTVEISQTIREDTMGGGNWITVDIDSISDFLDKEKRDFLPVGSKLLPVQKDSYLVPEHYNITDGPIYTEKENMTDHRK